VTTTLLLGGSGQLGSALLQHLDDVVALTRAEVDLATLTPDIAAALLKDSRATVIINCAAWTAVDAAEEAEKEATAVNGTSVGLLAEAADHDGVPFVTFSSDYVFDGTSNRPYHERDTPNPISAYGRSKLVGEEAALRYPRSLVIRTSGVQSATHPCFVKTILELAQERDVLRVVDDQTSRPTFADDLAAATRQVLDVGINGLIHIANDGQASWFELASETLRIAGNSTRIVPVPSAEFPTRAERPKYSVLDTSKAIEAGVDPLPSWRVSLTSTVESIVSMHS
jgi:dTDP-4-dehydrorhamnose reductase